MSEYFDRGGGNDVYRGGYGSGGFSAEDAAEIRDATSTFKDYVSGTVRLVFMVFCVFCLISVMTLALMGYARYLNRRKPRYGFYKPPDMLLRYPRKAQSTYNSSTLPRPSMTYSQATTEQAQQPSMAASQATLDSHRTTAASTML